MDTDKTSGMNRTAAIVRSYKNPAISQAVELLLDAGIGRVIVVTHGTEDKGATKGFLGSLLDNQRIRHVVIEEGYTWSNALNAGIQCVIEENFFRRLRRESEIYNILNISVEARFTPEQLDAMIARLNSSDLIGAVGTTFADLKGSSYRHPRNTCMAIKLAVLQELGFFNPISDSWGGQEDFNFLLFMAIATNYRAEMLDLQMELKVGVHYDQAKKEANERIAIQKIVHYWRSLLPSGSGARDRLESTLEKMFGSDL